MNNLEQLYDKTIQRAYIEWLERKRYHYTDALSITRLIQMKNNVQEKTINNLKSLLRAYEDFYRMDKFYEIWFLSNFSYYSVKRSFKYMGKHNKSIQYMVRDFILLRDFKTCKLCGSNQNIQVDHILPKAKYGASHPWNLQCLCEICNKDKSDRILNGYKEMIKDAIDESNALYTKSQVRIIYDELSKYYDTHKSDISITEKYFKELII